ncbi:hypothetical protein HYW82_01290 [Candidatus Peregrinibacteria bacterium]|nr:hypothetical protein [Candidatus Peregrinibacteria bacterium]
MQGSSSSLAANTLQELSAIVSNLFLLLSDKERTVIKRRFNVDGKGRSTLEEIGQSFSVTRERIRQIEKNALNKMKRNVFNTALKHLHDHVFELVRDHGGLVRRDVLVDRLGELVMPGNEVDLNSLDLSLVLHDGLDYVGNTINFYPYIRDQKLPEYSIKHASNQMVNQLHKYGDIKSLAKLHGDLKNLFDDLKFDITQIKSLIDIDKRITLLEDDFVGLLEWRHVHPRTLRDKILFILRHENKPMHFEDISGRIAEADFDGRKVNVQAVHNELIRHDSFVLIGRGIYALGEWGYEKGTVCEVIEKILSEAKELAQEEIIDRVLKQRQVKKITIVLALKNNKKFSRVGRKMYRLR